MTKADLVEEIAERTRISKSDTALIVNNLLAAVVDALKSNKRIEIRGFGTFKNRSKRGRRARNPRTGQEITVPPKYVPLFKASNELRSLVKGE